MPTLILICKYNDLYWTVQKIVGKGDSNLVLKSSFDYNI